MGFLDNIHIRTSWWTIFLIYYFLYWVTFYSLLQHICILLNKQICGSQLWREPKHAVISEINLTMDQCTLKTLQRTLLCFYRYLLWYFILRVKWELQNSVILYLLLQNAFYANYNSVCEHLTLPTREQEPTSKCILSNIAARYFSRIPGQLSQVWHHICIKPCKWSV